MYTLCNMQSEFYTARSDTASAYIFTSPPYVHRGAARTSYFNEPRGRAPAPGARTARAGRTAVCTRYFRLFARRSHSTRRTCIMYRLPSAHVVEQSVRRKTRPARARAGAPPAPPAASLTALASPVRHRLCRNIVLILEIEMTKSWSTTLFPKIFPHFQCLPLHTVPQRLSV